MGAITWAKKHVQPCEGGGGFASLVQIRFTDYSILFGSWSKTDKNNWFPLSGDVWQSAPSTFVRTSITAALTPAKWITTFHHFYLISWFRVDILSWYSRQGKRHATSVHLLGSKSKSRKYHCHFIISTNRTAGLGAAVPVGGWLGECLEKNKQTQCSNFGSKSSQHVIR